MKVAVVGATGMVGQVMLEILAQRNFPAREVLAVASAASLGKRLPFKNGQLEIIDLEKAMQAKPDLALFSAGATLSKEWAPRFAESGCVVIDNSSAWRMEAETPLVVPEVNGEVLNGNQRIIANPNCSTIQLTLVLNPLHRAYGIKRAVVSTYQSVSGSGAAAVAQMEGERSQQKVPQVYPYPIDRNCLPHCDEFLESGYTKEEMKLTRETKKILGDEQVQVTATAVRVPVTGGHSESVNLEFAKAFHTGDLRRLLADSPGISIQDNPELNVYPMPLMAGGKDEVFVGRIRRDLSQVNSLNLWIVSDNLRKGAALNAIQIAETLVERGFLSS